MTTAAECPLCGDTDVHPFNEYGPRCLAGDYHIVTGHVTNVWCGRCGAGWNRDMMGDAELSSFYGAYTKKVDAEDEDDLLFGAADAEVETLTASQARFLAEHVTASTGRMLDIGCGKGAFLKAFKAVRGGWRFAGIEPSREEVALARRDADLDVRQGMFGAVPLEREAFDVLTIMHVLEHVPRPLEAVRQMRDALKEGGLLFVEVPNTLDLNMFYDVLLFEHLFHFQPETLAWLLEREGFDIVAHQQATTYGAQRIVARKRANGAAESAWPRVRMADGRTAWQQLWRSMNELAEHGAARAADGRRVAVFGAGMTAATWLVYTALHDAKILGLFDESPWKIGRTLFDRPIHALSDIRTHAPDTVLLATMPNSQALVARKLAAICASGTEILGFGAGVSAR